MPSKENGRAGIICLSFLVSLCEVISIQTETCELNRLTFLYVDVTCFLILCTLTEKCSCSQQIIAVFYRNIDVRDIL